jgi:hypothetical protein
MVPDTSIPMTSKVDMSLNPTFQRDGLITPQADRGARPGLQTAWRLGKISFRKPSKTGIGNRLWKMYAPNHTSAGDFAPHRKRERL